MSREVWTDTSYLFKCVFGRGVQNSSTVRSISLKRGGILVKIIVSIYMKLSTRDVQCKDMEKIITTRITLTALSVLEEALVQG